MKIDRPDRTWPAGRHLFGNPFDIFVKSYCMYILGVHVIVLISLLSHSSFTPSSSIYKYVSASPSPSIPFLLLCSAKRSASSPLGLTCHHVRNGWMIEKYCCGNLRENKFLRFFFVFFALHSSFFGSLRTRGERCCSLLFRSSALSRCLSLDRLPVVPIPEYLMMDLLASPESPLLQP